VADPIVFPGTVEWSGENPGISLKDRPDGPFVALASFFRVVLSPHGRGHAFFNRLRLPVRLGIGRTVGCTTTRLSPAISLPSSYRISARTATSQVSRT